MGHDGPAPSELAQGYNFAITSEFNSKEDWIAYTQDPLYKSLDQSVSMAREGRLLTSSTRRYLTPYQEEVCIYQFSTNQ
jgi:hypothetical protein